MPTVEGQPPRDPWNRLGDVDRLFRKLVGKNLLTEDRHQILESAIDRICSEMRDGKEHGENIKVRYRNPDYQKAIKTTYQGEHPVENSNPGGQSLVN